MIKSLKALLMSGHTGRGNVAAIVCTVLIVLVVGGCSDKIRGTIKKELRQPGGGLTAILAEDYGKDVYYDVYIKRADGSTWRVFSTFDNDAAPDIKWANPNAVLIQMPCGTIVQYENQFEYPDGIIFIGLAGNRLCKRFNERTPDL